MYIVKFSVDNLTGEFSQDTLSKAKSKVTQIMKFIDTCSITKDGFEILIFNKDMMKNG